MRRFTFNENSSTILRRTLCFFLSLISVIWFGSYVAQNPGLFTETYKDISAIFWLTGTIVAAGIIVYAYRKFNVSELVKTILTVVITIVVMSNLSHITNGFAVWLPVLAVLLALLLLTYGTLKTAPLFGHRSRQGYTSTRKQAAPELHPDVVSAFNETAFPESHTSSATTQVTTSNATRTPMSPKPAAQSTTSSAPVRKLNIPGANARN